MNEKNYDYELMQRAIIDISQKLKITTPEIYTIKYGLSKENYEKLCEIVNVSLIKNNSYEQTYELLKPIMKEEDFDLEKYDELLHSFKMQFELYNNCDGILYKNLIKWTSVNGE